MLNGKCIIVTGASRGLGRAIALHAARNGARVGINYLRSESEAIRLRDEIGGAGGPEAVLLPFDATREASITDGVERFLKICARLDGLVNNAARNLPGLLPMLDEQEIRAQVESALVGPILCCRAALPAMLARRQGCILNIGSITADRVFRGQSVYAAAKGGIASFTNALAFEYARKGIRVNCLQPGPVDTDMFRQTDALRGEDFASTLPQGCLVDAESVAAMAVLLLSDRTRSMTGSIVNVDGGYAL